jgi:hypothetical protein
LHFQLESTISHFPYFPFVIRSSDYYRQRQVAKTPRRRLQKQMGGTSTRIKSN